MMKKFTTLTGIAAPLNQRNVDTDMIIPAVYLKTIKRTGLGVHLFQAHRYLEDGTENPEFVLNKEPYREAKILIAGKNFGCGSSREHAPWALADFGIRCVIAPSFADIFFNNSFKNGIVLIRLAENEVEVLMGDARQTDNAALTVDLEAQEIRRPNGAAITFDTEPHLKHRLLEGLDDIDLSLKEAPAIQTFEEKQRAAQPWLYR